MKGQLYDSHLLSLQSQLGWKTVVVIEDKRFFDHPKQPAPKTQNGLFWLVKGYLVF